MTQEQQGPIHAPELEGGEWLQGAGQFNFLSELTDADWEAIRSKKIKQG